jgi:hypothetical protein
VYTRSNLSNQIIPYHQKLQKLKKVPDKKGVVFSLFKNQLKQGFFVFITSFIIFSIVLTSFLTHVSAAKSQVAENSDLLNLKVKNLIELAGADRQSTFQSIKKIVKDSLTHVTGFTNTQWVVDRDMDKIENLANSWLNATNPLTLYSFSSVGFEHKSNPDRLFTNDLEDFFDELPSLQVETERVWSEMWLYRIIGNTTNDQKIKDLISSIEFFIKSISSIIQLKPLILKILGHYSTQRMVIFNQNVGEARPTGGFIGSHIPLDISQGKIVIGESQSIYYIDGQKKEGVVGHPFLWYSNYFYDSKDVFGGVRNLNTESCFTTTASAIEGEFSTSGNGYTIDQLVLVNPQFLQNIIPKDFSFNVDGVGTITRENFTNEVERVSSYQAPDKSNPKSLIGGFIKQIMSQLPQIIKKDGYESFFSSVIKSIDSRDLNIWFRDKDIQGLSSRFGFASEQACVTGKNNRIITPLVGNMSGDKRGLITQNRFSILAKPSWGGVKFGVSYISQLPENKNLQRGFVDLPNFKFVGFQIPKDSFDITVSSEKKLQLPFIKRDYLLNIVVNENKNYKIPKEIKTTIDTGRDLENGGFTYNQSDGSLVVGAYISDNSVGETRVDFEFTIPTQVNERIDFFGQPGLNEPSLFLGEGIDIYKNPTIREISDAQKIQSGITLITK